MLSFLRERGASARQLRLFACAGSRRVWSRLSPVEQRAVEPGESAADGRLDPAAVQLLPWGRTNRTPWSFFLGEAARVADGVCYYIPDEFRLRRGKEDERFAQADLLRDIFGDPFKPAAFDASWRSGTAVSLATRMYETRDFSLMPVLGDALQDAGCHDEEVLDHCRGPNVHVRGCWVIDLVLGRS
jgi:hypothetical protein